MTEQHGAAVECQGEPDGHRLVRSSTRQGESPFLKGCRGNAGSAPHLDRGPERAFLADPLDVPAEVIGYVAEQLDIADVSCVKAYPVRENTHFEHQWVIADEYGWRDFADGESELTHWVDDRAWITGDGPKTIFDAAVLWLRRDLDDLLRYFAQRLGDVEVDIDADGRLHAAKVDAIADPPSLTDLRDRCEAMMPQSTSARWCLR
jgi:hypothetical protein